VKWAVHEYVRRAPGQSDALFYFDPSDRDKARSLKYQITFSLRRSGLAQEGFRAGALRTSFESRIRNIDAGDGVADYLIGKAPESDAVEVWAERAPPLKLLTEVLKSASPIWDVQRDFWRR
jgi:hypothetical protein